MNKMRKRREIALRLDISAEEKLMLKQSALTLGISMTELIVRAVEAYGLAKDRVYSLETLFYFWRQLLLDLVNKLGLEQASFNLCRIHGMPRKENGLCDYCTIESQQRARQAQKK